MKKTNIIIPIFNAYEYTKRCIESVLKNTPKDEYNLILINDCSDDIRVAEYILKLEQENIDNIFIYNNKINLGYVRSVNKGMMLNASLLKMNIIKRKVYSFIKKNVYNNDVVLLNSDTEVTPNWLRKIKSAAYSNDKIATVTPLTNHGTICSIPENLKHNELPNNTSLDEYSDIIEKTSLKLHIEIPTAVGFCMFIKRNVLEEIGLFDAESFGKGYGEENDFCCRAKEKGYIHILCDDTFIYHKGNASFGDSQYEHRIKSRKVIEKKYPYYNNEVQKFISNNSIKPILDNIKLQLKIRNNKKNILFISHKNILSPYAGGSEYNTRDLIFNIKSVNFFCTYVQKDCIYLQIFIENEIIEFKFKIAKKINLLEFKNESYREIIGKIVDYFNIDCIHVKHFINNTFDIVEIAKERQVQIYLTLHDYYLICPRINLLDNNNKYCLNNISRENCIQCLNKTYKLEDTLIDRWNNNAYKYLKEFDRILAPSNSVVENFNKYYNSIIGEFKVEIEVVEHGLPDFSINNNTSTDLFRVAFLGALGNHKGSNIIYNMIQNNKNNRIEWHLFGYTNARMSSIDSKKIINHGKYEREQIQSLLINSKIDLICILSIWPETYCHTLSEALSARIPVLVTDLGALKERVLKYNCGWILNYDSTVEEILNMIEYIKDNKEDYLIKKKSLLKGKYPLKKDIYKVYEEYYTDIEKKKFTSKTELNRYVLERLLHK